MYDNFANIYDFVMRDTPYDEWISYYKKIFKKFNINPKLILDLGCGTGNITTRLAKEGYDMIGLDSSVSMLSYARKKSNDILYLNMDMKDFELYGTVDVIVSALDCMNYITEDIDKVFSLVYNYLNPGGIFIFDINSEYKLHTYFGKEPIICDEGDLFYIWDSEIENDFCHFFITFFTEDKSGKFHRCDECQTQRIYDEKTIKNAAEKAGLNVLGVYDNLSFSAPNETSERLFFVVSKEK